MQQALAAGSSSAHAANELAGLMSLISLQATQTQQARVVVMCSCSAAILRLAVWLCCQNSSAHRITCAMQVQQQAPTPMGAQYQQQQQQFSSGSEPAGMEVEGGTGPGPPPPHLAPADNEASRLAELAAAAEGASYMCPRCGGMVAVARFEAHQQLWCPARQGNG